MKQNTVESSARLVPDLKEKIRVLHVDHDSGFLKIAKQCLETEAPLEVDTAFSVKEALAKLEKEKYDIVVSDYQMPTKDGLEFLKELRKKGNRIPFIIFAEKGREEIAIKALNLGANQYLNKVGETETFCRELAHSIKELAKVGKTEERLRDSEEKFRNLAEQSPNIIFINKKGRIVYANKKAEEVMGYIREEYSFDSLNFLSLIAQESKRLVQSSFNKQIQSEETGPSEFTIITKEGKKIDVILNTKLIKYDNETAILGVITDITHQKQSEKTILESQQKFRALFMGNPEAAVHLSPDFHILDINPRFEKLFGHTLAEIKGKHLDDVIVQKDRLEEANNLNQKAFQGYVYHDTLRKRKDGTLVPVSVSAAPITVEGRLEGYIGMYKDISELKNTETALKETMEKLARTNEKLRVVGSLTRHDVKNKLTLVTGNAYLMKKKVTNDPEMLEHLRDMEEACTQIVKIFDFDTNYEIIGEEQLRYVDVAEAFDKAAAQFCGFQGVKIVNGCKGLTVVADSLLTRLFYNLIDNSLKYGEKLTQIKIHLENGQEESKLIYEDDGGGIPLEEKPRLFRQGYGKGTGYGLYLIKKIAEAYGWTIQETGEPGKGARFAITIHRKNQNSRENYRFA